MQLVVTGGCGFIGSALIRFLIEETDHSLVCIDNLTYAGNINNLKSIIKSKRFHFVNKNICDEEGIKEVFQKYKPNAIINLAAESHVDKSIETPRKFIETNILGTFVLLETSLHYWKSLDLSEKDKFRFLHVSTDEVYGDLSKNGDLNKNILFTEKTPYSPSSPYAASKAGSDHLVKAWSRTFGLPVLITNCSNNYGPFQYPEKLIPTIIINALKGNKLPVYGKGDQIRDWLYVNDHVLALYQILEQGKPNSNYNIGGNNEIENLKVVKKICCKLDSLLPMNGNSNINNRGNAQNSYLNLISFVADRPGHDIRYAIDTSKIKNDLGWKPIENFDTGLEKTIIWYINNENWWKSIIENKV